MQLKHFLKSHSLFRNLSVSDCDALAHAFEIREYAAGDGIVREGKPGKELYLLIEGEVRVTQYNLVTGELEERKALRPGELFGLLSLIDHLPTAAGCVATTPVKVGVLGRTGYNLLAQSAAPIALSFQFAVAKQLAADLRHQDESLRRMLV